MARYPPVDLRSPGSVDGYSMPADHAFSAVRAIPIRSRHGHDEVGLHLIARGEPICVPGDRRCRLSESHLIRVFARQIGMSAFHPGNTGSSPVIGSATPPCQPKIDGHVGVKSVREVLSGRGNPFLKCGKTLPASAARPNPSGKNINSFEDLWRLLHLGGWRRS